MATKPTGTLEEVPKLSAFSLKGACSVISSNRIFNKEELGCLSIY